MIKNPYIIIIFIFLIILILWLFFNFYFLELFLNFPTEIYTYQVTNSDNGLTSCTAFCAGTNGQPYNNELPANWNGADCIGTIAGGKCDNVKGTATQCICTPNNKGWSQ